MKANCAKLCLKAIVISCSVVLASCSGEAERASESGAGNPDADAGSEQAPPGGGGSAASGGSGTGLGGSNRVGGSVPGLGGASSTGGANTTGGSNGLGGNTGVCPETCDAPVTACVGLADGSDVPREVSFVGTVVSSSRGTVPEGEDCFGYVVPEDAVRVELADEAGVTWFLSFPRAEIGVDYFVPGAVLEVMHRNRDNGFPPVSNRLLTVHTDGELAVFFRRGSFEIPGLPTDLVIESGEPLCTSHYLCTRQKLETLVRQGSVELQNPCRARIGGLAITARATLLSGGSCDFPHEFEASGIRAR